MTIPNISAVQVSRDGLIVNGKAQPIYSGTVHYWRLDPALIPVSVSDSARVIAAVEQAVGPAAHTLFCDRAMLEQGLHPA